MSKRTLEASIVGVAVLSGVMLAQEMVSNWAAPATWSPPVREMASEKQSGVGIEAVEAIDAVPTAPLHFVGITPCRVADTRGNGFTGQYGPPALTPVGRNMVITGQCGIPGEAQAVSFNFSAVNVAAAGFFVAYPAGGAFPPVATMVYNQNTPNLSNAAVVPLGTGGAITVVAAVTTIDLVVDVNGYYRGGVVTAVNGLAGNVTLAAGSNVTITPSGQTLTVAATGGPGGVLPTGTYDQTLRHNGTNWVASSALTNDGTDVSLTGALTLPDPFAILSGNSLFLHNLRGVGSENTYVGQSAGTQPIPGNSNTGVGFHALFDAFTASARNVAVGALALNKVSSGTGNIGIGYSAGTEVTTGSNNLYIGSAPAGNESNQIRIGRNDVHTQGTVIASIYGFGSTNGIPVIVGPGGRLGTTTSSLRYKENVRDIGAGSDGLMSLRPVAFQYKKEHEPGGLTQYGLVAEEVVEIYPELVVSDEQGRPQAIRSQLFDGLFLNEIQKQHRKLETQETTISEQSRLIERQQAQLNDLRMRLAEIETRIQAAR